jgi:hypothetical protein
MPDVFGSQEGALGTARPWCLWDLPLANRDLPDMQWFGLDRGSHTAIDDERRFLLPALR